MADLPVAVRALLHVGISVSDLDRAVAIEYAVPEPMTIGKPSHPAPRVHRRHLRVTNLLA